MAIALYELGNVVSVAEFRLGKNINSIKPIEFRYLSNAKNETLYTHNRTIIEALLYGTIFNSQYKTEVRAIDKETEKENYFELTQDNICGTIDKYFNFIDISHENAKKANLKLDKMVSIFDYDKSENKTEDDYNYTYNMKNGIDFEIGQIPKDYIVKISPRSINITSKDEKYIDSIYIFYYDTVFMIDCTQENNHIEVYDFSEDKDNPKYYEFGNFIDTFIPFSGIPMMTILPTMINVNDQIITVEYGKFGLIKYTNDIYETGYFTSKEETISIHPMYLDIFDTGNVYNGKKYIVDYVKNEDDSNYVYYTRLIVEVDDPDELNKRIKSGEDIKAPKFDMFYVARDSNIKIVSNKEYIEMEMERTKKLFEIR